MDTFPHWAADSVSTGNPWEKTLQRCYTQMARRLKSSFGSNCTQVTLEHLQPEVKVFVLEALCTDLDNGTVGKAGNAVIH